MKTKRAPTQQWLKKAPKISNYWPVWAFAELQQPACLPHIIYLNTWNLLNKELRVHDNSSSLDLKLERHYVRAEEETLSPEVYKLVASHKTPNHRSQNLMRCWEEPTLLWVLSRRIRSTCSFFFSLISLAFLQWHGLLLCPLNQWIQARLNRNLNRCTVDGNLLQLERRKGPLILPSFPRSPGEKQLMP